MTPKLFYGLTIAAAVSLGVAGTTYYSTRTWAPNTEAGDPLLPGLTADAQTNVSALAIQQGEDTITIVRDGDGWGIKERHGFPADPEEVREVIVGLTQMAIIEEKTRNASRYHLLHLEDPASKDAQSKLVRLDDASGKPIASVVLGKIKFGVLGPGRNGTYVRKTDEPQTWLVSGDIEAPSDVRGWAQKTIFEIPKENVSQIKILHPDDELVVMVRGEGEGDVSAFGLIDLPEGAKIKEGVDLAFIATAIAQLELWDVRKLDEIKSDPETRPVISEVITKDGLKVTVEVLLSDGDDHWVSVSAEGPESAKEAVDAINTRAKGWAFKVQTYKVSNFTKRLAELVDIPEPKPEEPAVPEPEAPAEPEAQPEPEAPAEPVAEAPAEPEPQPEAEQPAEPEPQPEPEAPAEPEQPTDAEPEQPADAEQEQPEPTQD